MGEQPLNLDLSTEPADDPPTRQRRRPIWVAAGLVLLAVTAVVVGQLQRPRPVPPLATLVVPGSHISGANEGNWALLAVDLKNIGHIPVTVTNPHVEPGAGVTVIDARVEPSDSTLPLNGAWPQPRPVVINPMTSAQLVVRYSVDCSRVAFADPTLAIFSAVVVNVSAGNATAVANVTPGTSMVDASQLLCP